MNELLKSMKWGMMITGLLTIIIGIMICANPSGAIISIIRFIGWILIIAAGVSAISEFMQRTTTYRTYSTMTFALISLVFGIVLAIRPASFVNFVGTVVALILFVHGINAIVSALNSRKYGYNQWKIACLSGVIFAVVAFIILINPFSSASALMLFIGIVLIGDGISNIAMAFSIGRTMHTYHKNAMGDRYIDVDYKEVDDK
jgi:hypothetical protein